MRPDGEQTTRRVVPPPPLDWVDSDHQRHITAHRMDNIPTMIVLAHRSSHWDLVLDTTCLLCGAQPETAPHLWTCSAQSHEGGPARQRLAEWLDQKVEKRAVLVCPQLWEPAIMEQWAAALPTPSMHPAHMECSGPHTLGTKFIRNVTTSPSESGTPTPRREPRY